jgi:hypothetical protein
MSFIHHALKDFSKSQYRTTLNTFSEFISFYYPMQYKYYLHLYNLNNRQYHTHNIPHTTYHIPQTTNTSDSITRTFHYTIHYILQTTRHIFSHASHCTFTHHTLRTHIHTRSTQHITNSSILNSIWHSACTTSPQASDNKTLDVVLRQFSDPLDISEALDCSLSPSSLILIRNRSHELYLFDVSGSQGGHLVFGLECDQVSR